MPETRWLAFREPQPAPRLRMFCLPYGGGGASIYREWQQSLPAWVEVCPVQLPGHETRSGERSFHRMEPLVTALSGALLPYLDLPYVLFGHSLGALIAFELAHHFRRFGYSQPRHLFASGCPAPRTARLRDWHRQSSEQLTEELLRLGGTPEELVHNDEFAEWYLPTFRRDCEVYETYQYAHCSPLACPISAYRGLADAEVTEAQSRFWRTETSTEFRLHRFDGGHFFLSSQPQAVLRQVRAELVDLMERQP